MTPVHGDDFVTAGSRSGAAKFKAMLEGRFEIKTQATGARETGQGRSTSETVRGSGVESPAKWTETQEGRIPSRVVRWTSEGWELEPDPKHAQAAIRRPGLEGDDA